MTDDAKGTLTTDEAAYLLGVTRGTISGYIRDGRIKATSQGGRRYRVDAVDAARVAAIMERHNGDLRRDDLPVLYDRQAPIRRRQGSSAQRTVGKPTSNGRWEHFSSQELSFLLIGLRLFPDYGKWCSEIAAELAARGFHA